MSEAVEFASLDEAQEILNLMMRHWNQIASTLYKGEIHVPLVLQSSKELQPASVIFAITAELASLCNYKKC